MEKRNLTRSSITFMLCLFLFSGQIFAQSFSSTAAPVDIVPFGAFDDDYDGTLATMAAMPVEVSGLSSLSDITVDVTMNHTWVGDLTIKLEAPDGTIIGLMSRPGLLEPADDGTSCCGRSSNLLSSDPITYSDAAAIPAENMGDSSTSSAHNNCADDGICEYSPDPQTIGGFATLADFAAAVGTPSGTWTLYVGDSGGGDGGSLDAVTLNITGAGGGAGGAAVPTMSEWGLFMFFLVTLNLGLVFMYKMEAQKDMALAGGSASSSMSNNLPFEMNAFKAAMKHALGLAVVGFAIILVGWGEITSIDLIGMMMSIPMVAYIIQTANLLKK